ncbi:MAG TPA: hypothetical protein VE871_11400, partial [Longimicrobium sp.]|nr:hypothetical protein [Longimicrobium sp.]
ELEDVLAHRCCQMTEMQDLLRGLTFYPLVALDAQLNASSLSGFGIKAVEASFGERSEPRRGLSLSQRRL